MRLLTVVPYYKPATVYGGPARSIPQLYAAMAKLDVDVTVFTTNANGGNVLDVPLRQPVQIDDVTVFYYPILIERSPIGRFFWAPALSKACSTRTKEFDLVVLHDVWTYPSWRAAVACKQERVPYLVTPRGSFLPEALQKGKLKKQLYYSLFARRILAGASAIHGTAEAELEVLRSFHFHMPMFVVPNGIDAKVFERMPHPGKMRKHFGISDTASVLLFLGRIVRVKRPDIAVHTLAATQSLSQDVHLIIAGPDEGNLKKNLQAQAKQLGCLERLHFTGLLESDAVLSCLADADLLLMPSEAENFGMSAAEALGAGVPILVSDGVPVGRWAMENEAGRVVECSEVAFAEAACDLLSNPDQLRTMGRRGPEVMRQAFEISVVAQQMLEQYEMIAFGNSSLLKRVNHV